MVIHRPVSTDGSGPDRLAMSLKWLLVVAAVGVWTGFRGNVADSHSSQGDTANGAGTLALFIGPVIIVPLLWMRRTAGPIDTATSLPGHYPRV